MNHWNVSFVALKHHWDTMNIYDMGPIFFYEWDAYVGAIGTVWVVQFLSVLIFWISSTFICSSSSLSTTSVLWVREMCVGVREAGQGQRVCLRSLLRGSNYFHCCLLRRNRHGKPNAEAPLECVRLPSIAFLVRVRVECGSSVAALGPVPAARFKRFPAKITRERAIEKMPDDSNNSNYD